MRKMKSREMKPLDKTFQVASRWKGVTSLRFFILHPHYSYVVNISAKERNERCALKSNNQCRFSKQFSFLNPDYLTWAPTSKPSSILSQWVRSILPLSPLPTPPSTSCSPTSNPVAAVPQYHHCLGPCHALPCFLDKKSLLSNTSLGQIRFITTLRLLAISVRDQTLACITCLGAW